MNASVLPRYLIGSRKAILEIAASPWSLLIGAVLVLSAGFAREYDGEDLIHEPWHAFRPLAASLASGTTLFLLIHCVAALKREAGEGTPPPFGKAWRSFMGLFWFTAPMAWLYAIPYERFMSPVDAIAVNLWTLAAVSVWRVLLMVRVVHVVYGFGYAASFFLVMLFADVVVFTVVTLAPTPVIDVMGGLRQSERDALVSSVTLLVSVLAALTAPLWIAGSLVALFVLKPKWPDLSAVASTKTPWGPLIVAIASVVAFVPLLAMSQPQQINRREAEDLFRKGRVSEALAIMSGRSSDDYPPHWQPRPDTRDLLKEAIDAMLTHPPAEWVADVFAERTDRRLRHELQALPNEDWDNLVRRLEIWGRFSEIDAHTRAMARFLLANDRAETDADRAALERIATSPPRPDTPEAPTAPDQTRNATPPAAPGR